MNKQFFKIDKNIYLVDILSVLDVSYDDFFAVNSTNLNAHASYANQVAKM